MPVPDDISGSLSYPDVDQPSCQLLGPTALIVQGLLGILVLLSLVYKRHRETPKRPWRIWLFDVSKQVVGQMFVHTANLLAAGLVSHHTDGNACVNYFLNILIDTTFGIGLIYVVLHATTRLFTEKFHLKGFESGVYGDPPSIKYWARQAALYVFSLSAMKVVVVTFLVLFPAIYVAGEWLLSWTWTGDGDGLQVVFVMGIFPIIMNVLQFWLIDSIVKASIGGETPVDLEHGTYHDREPLFNAPPEDDDDGRSSRDNISENRNSRRSISSLDSRAYISHDDLSFDTGGDEHKSAASSSKNVDAHSYPPSLSSSMTSNSNSAAGTKAPREAKNLLKKTKRRDPPSALHLRSTTEEPLSPNSTLALESMPPTPSPKLAPVSVAQPPGPAEWTDAWDDSNDWAYGPENQHALKQKSLATAGEWTNAHPTISVNR